MDQNKLKALRDINYSIQDTCKSCKHATLSPDGWGTCNLYVYKHIKHGICMHLSINENGYCSKYERDETSLFNLGLFREFAEK